MKKRFNVAWFRPALTCVRGAQSVRQDTPKEFELGQVLKAPKRFRQLG
jgi:hypothetical protein